MGASVRIGLSLGRVRRAGRRASLSLRAHGRRATKYLIHNYLNDIDAVSSEFDMPVDEDGPGGRECVLADPDGNRLRVAARRA